MKYPFALVLAVALMACGGGAAEDGGDDDAAIDASVPDGPAGPCDPVAQTGCADGLKCTWIQLTDDLGTLGCVPTGTRQTDETCVVGPFGEDSGFDDCVAGAICSFGVCLELCSATDVDSCGHAEDVCRPFISEPPFGACYHECDPVTQVRALGDAAACGSADPSSPGLGCYFASPDFLCLPVAPQATALVQDDPAYGPYGSYLNGCAPGYGALPSLYPGMPTICTAFCRPVETSLENQAGAEGDPASSYTCSDRGAANHECRFYWFFEALPISDDNGVGLCWNPGDFVHDWDGDAATAPSGAPACTTLTTADTDTNGVPDNEQYGCAPY